MGGIPSHIRAEVSRIVLERAVEMGWEDLPNIRKSAVYEEWASAPEIGGRLAEYVPPERIRVWIKDGPMKEFKRAKRGLGPYAYLAPKNDRREEEIRRKMLGDDWQLVEGSIHVKPNRFDAQNGEKRLTVLWGTTIDLKHLVWAWLHHRNPQDCRLVVVETKTEPVTSTIRGKHNRLAGRLGINLIYVSIR